MIHLKNQFLMILLLFLANNIHFCLSPPCRNATYCYHLTYFAFYTESFLVEKNTCFYRFAISSKNSILAGGRREFSFHGFVRGKLQVGGLIVLLRLFSLSVYSFVRFVCWVCLLVCVCLFAYL